MVARLAELLRQLDADSGSSAGDLFDEIEAEIESDPVGSRPVVLAYQGRPGYRIRALGLLGDPADFDTLEAALADSRLRDGALEALGCQPDGVRVDAIARALLDDPNPGIRARAAGLVAFYARPGALGLLAPLVRDPDRHVRTVLGWRLRAFGEAALPSIEALLNDPDEQVRSFAARGLQKHS